MRRAPAFDQTIALYLFVEPIKALIHAAKFGAQWQILGNLAQFESLLAQLKQADWIIPMPLHANRLKERGFNQAGEIAQPLSRASAIPIRHDVLARIRDTEHQARLSAKARWKNLRRAFACQCDCTGKTILLVDDVMTSGASLHAAAKVLKAAGAARIINVVLARTPSQPYP
ncbi:ComF family protein [Chitinibacter bivalviorum]|nr:ComF family protein [Chitinibacter bivalviorum]